MTQNSNGNGDKAPAIAWVKVIARSDGSIEVENKNMDMDNPKNIAAVLDLLACGVSALCHTRLARMGTESRIMPAGMSDLSKVIKKVGS